MVLVRHHQRPGGIADDAGRLIDEGAGECEVAVVECVADGGEEGGPVILGPGPGPEDDVLELRPVWSLLGHQYIPRPSRKRI